MHHRNLSGVAAIATAALLALPAIAETIPRRIETRAAFLELVGDRQLTRLGVSLEVRGDGEIEGRVLGREVRGIWEWRDGFFCRDFMGEDLLGYDCQTVELRGDRLRFTAGDGSGETLDLRLR
jgi:hypothetical protein